MLAIRSGLQAFSLLIGALRIANYELICGRKNVHHKIYVSCFGVVESYQKYGKYFYCLHKVFL